MLEAQSEPSRTMYRAGNGRKWPKIGHLDQVQPQISILGEILKYKATLIPNIKCILEDQWIISDHVEAINVHK